MKKFVTALSLSALMLVTQPISNVNAATSFAKDLGIKLVTSIIGVISSEQMKKFFGGPVTKEDLDKSLDEHFDAFSIKLLREEMDQLQDEVEDYSFTTTNESIEITDMNDVFEAVRRVDSKIKENMSDQHFWELIPNYVYSTNVHLAFLAQKQVLDPEGGWDEKIGTHAYEAMRDVFDYWSLHMIDTASFKCLRKEHHQTLFIDTQQVKKRYLRKHGNEQAYTGKLKKGVRRRLAKMHVGSKDSDFSTKQCVDLSNESRWKNLQLVEGYFVPAKDFFRPGKVFKNPLHDKWYFMYRKAAKSSDAWVGGPYDSESHAKAERVKHTVDVYQERLGDVRSNLNAWYDLVHHFGSASEKRHSTDLKRDFGL